MDTVGDELCPENLILCGGKWSSDGEYPAYKGYPSGRSYSPYLFLFCAEAFSALISQTVDMGVITRVPTSPRGPRLSHLLFTDDSLLFCKAKSV
jgi:hypothetical protein